MSSHSGFDLTFKTVEALFLQLFNEQNACQALGFIAISRLLDKDPITHCNPGWYLWIKGHAGGFLLEWVGAEDDPADAPEPVLRSDFVIRYYPDPSEEIFLAFSDAERLARVGPSFDHTATPHFQARSDHDPSWFAVGGLRLSATPDLPALTLTLAAQDRDRQRRRNKNAAGSVEASVLASIGDNDAMDRDVPAWGLAFDLFDRLVRAFAYCHRSRPSAFEMSESPGQIAITEAGRPVSVETDHHTKMRQLSVTLPLTYAHHRLSVAQADATARISRPDTGFAPAAWWSAADLEVAPSNFVCERCLGADDALDSRFAGLVESPRIGDFHV